MSSRKLPILVWEIGVFCPNTGARPCLADVAENSVDDGLGRSLLQLKKLILPAGHEDPDPTRFQRSGHFGGHA